MEINLFTFAFLVHFLFQVTFVTSSDLYTNSCACVSEIIRRTRIRTLQGEYPQFYDLCCDSIGEIQIFWQFNEHYRLIFSVGHRNGIFRTHGGESLPNLAFLPGFSHSWRTHFSQPFAANTRVSHQSAVLINFISEIHQFHLQFHRSAQHKLKQREYKLI